MLALAGYPLGLPFRFLDPSPEAPVGRIATRITAQYTDRPALKKFAAGLELVTYEFENMPVEAARFLAELVPVLPPPAALEAAQDRLNEKRLFQKLGIVTTEFAAVADRDALDSAINKIGLPAVLQKCPMGYDGQGQWLLRRPEDVLAAKNELPAANPAARNHSCGAEAADQSAPFLLERLVPFNRELSILAVRGRTGETAVYPLVENHHRGGILRLSLAPAPQLDRALQHAAAAAGPRR